MVLRGNIAIVMAAIRSNCAGPPAESQAHMPPGGGRLFVVGRRYEFNYESPSIISPTTKSQPELPALAVWIFPTGTLMRSFLLTV